MEFTGRIAIEQNSGQKERNANSDQEEEEAVCASREEFRHSPSHSLRSVRKAIDEDTDEVPSSMKTHFFEFGIGSNRSVASLRL
jgi:hypothetical protein